MGTWLAAAQHSPGPRRKESIGRTFQFTETSGYSLRRDIMRRWIDEENWSGGGKEPNVQYLLSHKPP